MAINISRSSTLPQAKTTSFNTTFNEVAGSDGSMPKGWTNRTNGFKMSGGKLVPNTASNVECNATMDDIKVMYNGEISYIVEIVHDSGVTVRADDTGGNLYLLQCTNTATTIFKRVSGTYTQIGTNTNVIAKIGDKITLRIIGNKIDALNNDKLVLTVNDSTFTSGKFGVRTGVMQMAYSKIWGRKL